MRSNRRDWSGWMRPDRSTGPSRTRGPPSRLPQETQSHERWGRIDAEIFRSFVCEKLARPFCCYRCRKGGTIPPSDAGQTDVADTVFDSTSTSPPLRIGRSVRGRHHVATTPRPIGPSARPTTTSGTSHSQGLR